jgi:tRNA pseudouridine32 synthase/23S rRNA pseudouridine746 synthase
MPIHDDYLPPPHDPSWLLVQDEALLLVNKPAGLLSVPGRGAGKDDCLISRVQAQFAEAQIVHRLDLATSGLLLLARGEEMQRRFSRLFRERLVHKNYIAVVAGQVAQAEGEIDLPLITDWPNRPLQKVDFDIGKPSLTRYRSLGYDANSDSTRLLLEPVTGRSHQLRVHLAAIGHPILGDVLYAGEHRLRAPRLLLHAASLQFPHPVSGEVCRFDCPPSF